MFSMVYLVIMLAITAFASYKLAEEKGQHKIIWPLATLLVGPVMLALQYLISIYRKRNAVEVL